MLSAPGRRYFGDDAVYAQWTSSPGRQRALPTLRSTFSSLSSWVLPLLQILLFNARALEPPLVVGT